MTKTQCCDELEAKRCGVANHMSRCRRGTAQALPPRPQGALRVLERMARACAQGKLPPLRPITVRALAYLQNYDFLRLKIIRTIS